VLLLLLIVQGLIGGFDTLINHEILVRLPRRPEARTEVGIHVLREASYGLLFAALAWLTWQGLFAIVIGMLLLATILIDAWDEFIENRTRVLPQNERLLHFLLILNLGVITVVLVPTLSAWLSQPTKLEAQGHGVLSWVLSFLAVAALGWSVRDLLAWRALGLETNGQETLSAR
jgi:hypothetical protein